MAVVTEARALVQLLTSRRSIRRFSTEPIEDNLIRELVDVARWAPSPHNAQPWRFTLLKEEARERLAVAMAGQLARELTADGVAEDEIQKVTSRSIDRISSAPAALLCSLVRTGLVAHDDVRLDALEREMAVQSVGAVLQTLFLGAWDRGIGTCWVAAPMYCPGIVRDVLDLPSNYEPQALVLLGYPSRLPPPRDRRPLPELLDTR